MATPQLDEFPAPHPDPVIAEQPVGSVLRAALGSEGLATASYDVSEQWRFRLSRVWDAAGTRCLFVMLNPSTATELELDRTVARCVRFAELWGHGALEVVNIFAFRATKPADMKACEDPVGEGNDEAIVAAARRADEIVAAWGAHGAHLGRGEQVRRLLDDVGAPVHYLRLTKKGHPGHPLYVRGTSAPQLWAP